MLVMRRRDNLRKQFMGIVPKCTTALAELMIRHPTLQDEGERVKINMRNEESKGFLPKFSALVKIIIIYRKIAEKGVKNKYKMVLTFVDHCRPFDVTI